jgi:hypothetical protein
VNDALFGKYYKEVFLAFVVYNPEFVSGDWEVTKPGRREVM